MSTYPDEFLPKRHNHPTLDIKARGECPSCDEWWKSEDERQRIKKPLSVCKYCGIPMGVAPEFNCTRPGDHKARFKNHRGVGRPPA